MSRTKTFSGGTHPPEYKEATEQLPIVDLALPGEVFVPLHQHIGAPCQATVEPGQEVLRGQKIGDAEAFVSAPVHSPVTGTVVGIAERDHFNGQQVNGVLIRVGSAEDQERTAFMEPLPSWQDATADAIRSLVRQAGIVGLGGAAFPTHVKLAPPADKPIEAVIINGCECEPFLTCDHRLLLEQAEKMITGALVMKKAVNANRVIIGIEDNKPDALSLMSEASASHPDVEVVALETKYPQGAEKQLIKAVLGREVPARQLPMEVGALVHNVGTAVAVCDAVMTGRPLIDRVLTVSGPGAVRPANVRVPLGTSIDFVLGQLGGLKDTASRVVVGGPMTGWAQHDLSSVVVKGTSGILVLDDSTARRAGDHYVCVRCQRCVRACPMFLYPNFLGTAGEISDWTQADAEGALDCVECGACAYVCPAQRPIVRFVRAAKAAIWEQQRS